MGGTGLGYGIPLIRWRLSLASAAEGLHLITDDGTHFVTDDGTHIVTDAGMVNQIVTDDGTFIVTDDGTWIRVG